MPRKNTDSAFTPRTRSSSVRAAFRVIGFGPLLVGASAVTAQDADLAKCLAIADVDARVQCYDAIAQSRQGGTASIQINSSGRPQAAPDGSEEAVLPPSDASRSAAPRTQFGLSEAEREKLLPKTERQLDSIRTVVTSAQLVGAGYWQYTMQDGSTWRMAENPPLFRPPESGDTVQIRRGALGSYYLDADRQPGVRIKRVG